MSLTVDTKRLGSPLAEGGEAQIFDLKNGKVAKIFKSHVPFKIKQRKVQLLLQNLHQIWAISPKEEVMDSRTGQFIGYVMDKVVKADPISQYSKRKVKQIAGKTNKDCLMLLLDLGHALLNIHKAGFIVGDLNSQNVLVTQSFNPFFIDTDSWGVAGMTPDAYTELFIPTECWNGDKVRADALTKFSDIFSYNIICFQTLVNLHPFGGTYKLHPGMSTVDRIRKRVSILGKNSKDITIPKMVEKWDWMSPDLQDAFEQCFNRDTRVTVTDLLKDQLDNSTFCPTHNLYYYSKYGKCPVCTGTAKIATITKKTATGEFKLTELYAAENIWAWIDFDKALIGDREPRLLGHFKSFIKIPYNPEVRTEFSDDGHIIFYIYEDHIDIPSSGVKTVQRKFKSSYTVTNNVIHYVDEEDNLTKLTCTPMGNMKRIVMPGCHGFFGVGSNGCDLLVVQNYRKPTTSIVSIQHEYVTKNIDVGQVGKITEYFIQQDTLVRDNWILVYKTETGKFRTLVFGTGGIAYDTDSIDFVSLNGLCFFNGTLYYPGNGEIIAHSFVKNTEKRFPCHVVTEDSQLRFRKGGFDIITDVNKMWRFES